MPVKQSLPFPGTDRLPPLVKTLVDRIFPQDELPMDMAVPAAPLISIYRDKGSRIAATEAYKAMTEKMGMGKAGKWFADQYPRLAAHKQLNPVPKDIVNPDGGTPFAMTDIPYGKVEDRVPITFSTEGLKAAQASEGNARHILAHEGLHTAQALGNRNTKDLYELSRNLVDYQRIPHEVTAIARGNAAQEGSYFVPRHKMIPELADDVEPTLENVLAARKVPYTANRGLKLLAAGVYPQAPKYPEIAPTVSDMIDHILRGGTVARRHNPDGTIGYSKRSNPKY